jgi:Bacteriocin-protection, YdeI or OmpD-Associated/Domain of unknown function (DUF1905)
MGSIQLRTTLQPRGNASAVVLDDAAVATVGEGAKRFPVVATVNGHTWRTSVARMHGESLLGLSRAIREAASVEVGDEVDVTLELDRAPREVEMPPALTAALADDEQARAAFEALAFTHRKEFARWIEEAKREETRTRRIDKTLEMLREGRTRS